MSKDDIIQAFELEACGFGSVRLALREFRKMTGAREVRRLKDLKAYLTDETEDALRTLLDEFKRRLAAGAYPKAT